MSPGSNVFFYARARAADPYPHPRIWSKSAQLGPPGRSTRSMQFDRFRLDRFIFWHIFGERARARGRVGPTNLGVMGGKGGNP